MANVDELLKLVDCPVCWERLTPPVETCENGHAICQKCKSSLQVCPTCRGKFHHFQNTLLNQLLESLPMTCKYQESGCSENVTSKDCTEHELICNYRPVECFECLEERLTYCELGKHLMCHEFAYDQSRISDFGCWQGYHIGKSEPLGFFGVSILHQFGENLPTNVEDFRSFFVLRHSLNWEEKILYVGVQRIGKTEEAKEYLFEIRIDQKLPYEKKIYYTYGGFCLPYSGRDFLTAHSQTLFLNLDKIFVTDEEQSGIDLDFRVMPVLKESPGEGKLASQLNLSAKPSRHRLFGAPEASDEPGHKSNPLQNKISAFVRSVVNKNGEEQSGIDSDFRVMPVPKESPEKGKLESQSNLLVQPARHRLFGAPESSDKSGRKSNPLQKKISVFEGLVVNKNGEEAFSSKNHISSPRPTVSIQIPENVSLYRQVRNQINKS